MSSALVTANIGLLMRTLTVTDGNYSKIISALADPAAGMAPDLSEVRLTVAEIISAVRYYGDAQLINIVNQFDRNNIAEQELRVVPEAIDAGLRTLSTNTIKALELASVRIHTYHEKMKPQDVAFKDKAGIELGSRWLPMDSVGIYVAANNPSAVFMNAIPARIAGVSRIAMVTPAIDGDINPAILAAAKICGITEIYRAGGAGGIAALAYGTQTIKIVDKIAGSGDVYVNEAKKQVFGAVGIDIIDGAHDVAIIADEKNDPYWVAADMLAHAEHGGLARPILITTSQSMAQQIISCIYEILPELGRYETAQAAIEKRALAIVVNNLEEAAIVSNLLSPKKVQLSVEKPKELLPRITNAGYILLGQYAPSALSDFVAGPSNILPTGFTSRFSSGITVADFMKQQSILSADAKSFKDIANATALLAQAEGLGANALSITMRQGK